MVGPQCAATPAHAFVIWQDDRGTFDRQVRLNHTLWTAPFAVADVRLDTPGGATTSMGMPVIATGDGAAYVAWHDDRGGVPAVYLNTARP